MSKAYKLKINNRGIDQVDYTVLQQSGTVIAKVEVKIDKQIFILKKHADSVNSLNRKINIAIRNLKSKAKQKREKYSDFELTG